MRPRACTTVAWEKWPLGWRILGDTIWVLGMGAPARYPRLATKSYHRQIAKPGRSTISAERCRIGTLTRHHALRSMTV
jgi:hypothetical protein